MRTSIFHKSKTVTALASAAVTAVTNGATVDLHQSGAGDYRTALFIVQTGTVTDGSYVVSLEHSDNGTVWEAAPIQGSTSTAIAATDDNVLREYGYAGQKRFCRVRIAATGATTGGIFSALAVLYDTAGYKR